MENKKEKDLRHRIAQYTKKDVAVAFSGGVDSSLLLKFACREAEQNGTKVYAVIVHTKLHPLGELEEATEAAASMGAEPKTIFLDELKDADIEENPIDRCYRCKKCLFSEIKKLAEDLHVPVILEGTNEDDLHVYRPGIRAIQELGIQSPLADAELSKMEIRELARKYGVTAANKPSLPCLATRFPYGTRLTYEKMKKADQGEAFLRKLGFYNVRPRVYDDLVRLEVDAKDMDRVIENRAQIIDRLKSLGYTYITLDLEGFRSGSMDVTIEKNK